MELTKPCQLRSSQGQAEAVIPRRGARRHRRAMTRGTLIDLSEEGAQVDLDRPLTVGQRVTLVFHERGKDAPRASVVRWVTKVEGRFHHGLRFDP